MSGAMEMEPLPFRLQVTGHDAFEGLDVVSISVKVEGLAEWSDGILTLEWSETQYVDEVSIGTVRSDVIKQPALAVDIPVDILLGAAVAGGWWRPRVELRARTISAFAHIPGSAPGRLTLRIARRDRALAKELVATIQEAIAADRLPAGD